MRTRGPRRVFFGAVAALAALLTLSGVGAQTSAIPDVVRGQHIATALTGCEDCHGANFAGGQKFTRGDLIVYSANLTPGAGGIGSQSTLDLRRAIRTGVRADGTQVRIMPWREYAALTDADVDDVIAFLRSLPAVDRTVPPATIPAALPSPGASMSDNGGVHAPLTGGTYLATIGGCMNCHGADLTGTDLPGGVHAPNISHTAIGAWSFADFQTAMRTGLTPDRRVLSKRMPWQTFAKMTDEELRSVYDFLQSKPG